MILKNIENSRVAPAAFLKPYVWCVCVSVCEKCTTLNEWERVATVSKNCENDLCTWHIFVSYLHMLRHMLVLIRSCFHHQLNAVWQHTWIIVCVRAVVRCRNLCRIPGKQPIVPDNLVYIHLCITIGYGRLFFFLPCSPLPCDAFYILLFLSHSPLYRDFWRKKKTRSEFVVCTESKQMHSTLPLPLRIKWIHTEYRIPGCFNIFAGVNVISAQELTWAWDTLWRLAICRSHRRSILREHNFFFLKPMFATFQCGSG